MPPPQECVEASAQLPPGHDEGERPTHLPPAATHAFDEDTQSKPTVQPLLSLCGTVLPPGQKPGAGWTMSGHDGGWTQSKPPGQPFAPMRGTTLPPGQKLGDGGESTGHEMQQAAPMPGPHDTFVASAK